MTIIRTCRHCSLRVKGYCTCSTLAFTRVKVTKLKNWKNTIFFLLIYTYTFYRILLKTGHHWCVNECLFFFDILIKRLREIKQWFSLTSRIHKFRFYRKEKLASARNCKVVEIGFLQRNGTCVILLPALTILCLFN